MTTAHRKPTRVTFDDYLAFEETATVRHELIGVLSPSTERLDRGEKKLNYLQIPSLQEYVLVAQDKPKVEVMRRGTSWSVEELYLDETLTLGSVGLTLPLADIYRTITF